MIRSTKPMIASPEIEARRRDRLALEELIRSAGSTLRGTTCTCPDPRHDDHNPSASIYQDDQGVWRYRCHRCESSGDCFDLEALLSGRTLSDVLRDHRGEKAVRTPSTALRRKAAYTGPRYATELCILEQVPDVQACYRYKTAEGRDHALVLRLQPSTGPKSFRQFTPDPDGFWIAQGPRPSHPPYRIDQVMAESDPVVIVEGEKACDHLRQYGITATTSIAGAGKAHLTDWSLLAGRSTVLWPDFDDAGEKHMDQLQDILQKLDPRPSISRIDPRALALHPKDDAFDYVENQLDHLTEPAEITEAIRQALMTATRQGAGRGVQQLIDDAVSGRRFAAPTPWPVMHQLSRALLPGTLTVFSGSPGASKSFSMLQWAAHLHQSGHRVELMEAEDGVDYHLRRYLAQISGESHITDDDWCQANPVEADRLVKKYREQLDSFGACLTVPRSDDPDHAEVIQWLEQRAAAGVRILMLDSVSVLRGDDKPWITDRDFLVSAKRIVEQQQCSLVVVAHPRKGAEGTTADDLSGSAAYGRLAHCILWLQHITEEREEMILDPTTKLRTPEMVNRIVVITKSRNSRGAGKRIGFWFDGDTLRLKELGLIVKKD